MSRYSHDPSGYRAWLNDCRARTRQHKDNVFLFTGDEGGGKSSLLRRIFGDLDNGFTIDRMHYGATSFLAHASTHKPGECVAADEIETTGRRATSTANVDLLLFLKECRGLRLNIGICWPHLRTFDQAILRDRVQWLIEITSPLGLNKPATWILSERVTRRIANKHGAVDTVTQHVPRGSWTFAPKKDAQFDAYQNKKLAHMESLSSKYAAKLSKEEEAEDDLRSDPGIVALLERLKTKN